MILALVAKGKKTIVCVMLALMYFEMVVPPMALGNAGNSHYKKDTKKNTSLRRDKLRLPSDDIANGSTPITAPIPPIPSAVSKAAVRGGPTQPESQAFHSVNADNMVDLFSGDFSYTIPLLDVGGYPVAIGYNSGISMDQEASWTGLGWNINPGTITRNMRGLPDDFNGVDSVIKTTSIKENKTMGVTFGGDLEVTGVPIGVKGSQGIFHNTYRGWGIENSLNANINVASGTTGLLTGGLSVTNNSQEGLTISPSISYSITERDIKEKGGFGGNLSVSPSYNTRSGMKALQFSAGVKGYKEAQKIVTTTSSDNNPAANPVRSDHQSSVEALFSSYYSFAYPSFTPTISLPYTNNMYTVTLKGGTDIKVYHPSGFTSGYVASQRIADQDKTAYMPAYGYLNYQEGAKKSGCFTGF